jgi:hypothetical protein
MAIRISTVKSSHLSEDKKEVIVASTGKYAGDLELRFGSECVDDLLNALINARRAMQPASAAAERPVAAASAPPKADGEVNNIPPQVTFEVPRNFAITADGGRRLVLFIVNHKLDRQAGFAFSPDAAKQLAVGLVKSAEALLAQPAVASKS